MNRTLSRLLVVALGLCLVPLGTSAADSADESALRQLEVRQQETWNRHDAKAYAALFAEDGDCVNVVGWWWKGRAQIESKLTEAYAFVFRESVLTLGEVNVRFLDPKMAIVHVRWTMTGARTPQGLPTPQQGIQTQLVQKSGEQWLIAAFQNTNSLPEMPFPKGPPAGRAAAAPPKP